jgi:hypothetical protein
MTGRKTSARLMATLLVAMVVCPFGRAKGSPADIFSSPAPVLGSEAPKAADVKDGDTTVATQTGALQYSYPIAVAPGRMGMAPSLSFNYSSQAPIYGSNLGAGWTLNIPRIEEDTSRGRLRSHYRGLDPQGADPTGDDQFSSSLAGGRPLVKVTTDPTAPTVTHYYRAQSDSSFARYQRMDSTQDFRWRVLFTDGSTMYFGDASKTVGCPISDHFAPLTRHVDAFGNEVSYDYIFVNKECVLSRIAWGQNATAGLSEFAEVRFTYERARQCPGGIEATSQQRFVTSPPTAPVPSTRIIAGANKIVRVEVKAFEPGAPSNVVHTRQITLGYDDTAEECSPSSGPLTHAPVRLLTSIQESAWGVDSPRVDLPAVTFTYGPAMVSLVDPNPGAGASTPWFDVFGRPDQNFAWGFRNPTADDRWPTVEAMMLDLDGDGLPDRIQNAWVTENGVTSCRATWQRNEPTTSLFQYRSYITFGDNESPNMPRLRWQGTTDPNGSPNQGSDIADANPAHWPGEACALNGQVTAYHNSHATPLVCHDGTTCELDSFCPDGNPCPNYGQPNPRTYLAYRWLDMDGDGLVDLVAGIHGTNHRYDVIRGNDAGSSYEPPLFGTVPIPSGFPPCSNLPTAASNSARTA